MKKMISILTIIYTLISCACFTVHAASNVEWINSDNYKSDYRITYCGNGYLKWIGQDSLEFNENETNIKGVDRISENKFLVCFSSDCEHWENILNENNKDVFSRYYNNHKAQCSIIYTGENYIMYYNNFSPFGINSNRDPGRIAVFDESFNVIKECNDLENIANISYVDGVCYVVQYTEYLSDTLPPNRSKYGWRPYIEYGVGAKQKTICTSDFENWEVYSDDGDIPLKVKDKTIEIRNSLLTEVDNYNRTLSFTKPTVVYALTVDNKSEILYENMEVSWISVLRDIYIAVPNYGNEKYSHQIGISNDGIYYTMVELPNDRIRKIYSDIDSSYVEEIQKLELQSIYEYDESYFWANVKPYHDQNQGSSLASSSYFCKIDDLKNNFPDSKTYVQLNDKILGFSQPPVMEDDRILVPMRFLFEQMGASVDWNDETQTATASVPMSAELQMMIFNSARGGGGERNGMGERKNIVTFSIDNTTATVNGVSETMDVPARLINDQTFVPLRFLSENLGCDVQWDETVSTAIVTTK